MAELPKTHPFNLLRNSLCTYYDRQDTPDVTRPEYQAKSSPYVDELVGGRLYFWTYPIPEALFIGPSARQLRSELRRLLGDLYVPTTNCKLNADLAKAQTEQSFPIFLFPQSVMKRSPGKRRASLEKKLYDRAAHYLAEHADEVNVTRGTAFLEQLKEDTERFQSLIREAGAEGANTPAFRERYRAFLAEQIKLSLDAAPAETLDDSPGYCLSRIWDELFWEPEQRVDLDTIAARVAGGFDAFGFNGAAFRACVDEAADAYRDAQLSGDAEAVTRTKSELVYRVLLYCCFPELLADETLMAQAKSHDATT